MAIINFLDSKSKMVIVGDLTAKGKFCVVLIVILVHCSLNCVIAAAVASAACEYGVVEGNKEYKYCLASAVGDFPLGVISEDGFYKVTANDTILWFQLCDGMIFNHDFPRCVDCSLCGGSKHCGLGCGALVANNIGGYFVCDIIGSHLSFDINLLDQKSPHTGIILKLGATSSKSNCSLSVHVMCSLGGVQEPKSLEKSGTCDYATVLRHPSGCALVVLAHRDGWGWFETILTILVCLLGAYLLTGVAYRYFFLRIRGLDVIPNLDFWSSMPHRTQSLFMSAVHKFRGPIYHHGSSIHQ